jgi:Protein of unknown function (DUF4236)/Bacterial SH3 domain
MLKGVRWQKRITIIPGLLRINLSKSGVSASAGPEGADVNIGRKGITTSAGIPGTGLSYRQKMGGGRGMLGILLVIAGLGWWAFQHWSKVEKIIAPMRSAATQAAAPAPAPSRSSGQSAPVNTAASPLRYVHRQGAILREEAKSSGKVLKKSTKGDLVTLIAQSDGWAKVTDGNVTGWMRASTLGTEPPK